MKALIVDDVLFTRLIMEEALKIAQSKGKLNLSHIEQAESYKEAVKKLQKEQFNLVITDINLKDGLGTELAKFVKRKYPESKVIALTMYPEEFEKYKDVFDEFIKKPISSEELEEKIEKIIK
ncbi:response regulator [Desulfurobacterium atlanticum]|uniref:Response regulator receiver domain-containing protein n=1 Tax=Desulfurobacterium atlanticum TaxID=240169 RepID=A0A238YXG8_9BACT|nr:response regulator [Desulfurobacterium atlanticum]SNR75770.1 Response regulator receiver domain-containing protein [Desulfurobacterium atlanticum]